MVGNISLGLAQVEEIRRVMDEIKAAGKEVDAHADSLSLRTYTLVCGASKLSVVPTGDLFITGLHGEIALPARACWTRSASSPTS